MKKLVLVFVLIFCFSMFAQASLEENTFTGKITTGVESVDGVLVDKSEISVETKVNDTTVA